MSINRAECKKIRAELATVLEALKGTGYQARIMPNANFDSTKMTLKIEISAEGVDMEQDEFAKSAFLFNLKPEDYGTTATVGRLGEVRLVELRPKSPKYPFIVERLDNQKRYKMSEAQFFA